MSKTLESRYLAVCRKVEGRKEITAYEHTHRAEAQNFWSQNITPMNPWHRRILAELDFCLQLRAHGGVECDAYIDAALGVLEAAHEAEGVLTDAACKKAEDYLLPLQEEAKTYEVLMVGHAHLDMNWQWGMDETVATVVATFKTMLRLMEEYPHFHFSQSQASTYKIIEDYAPELVEPIKQRIREGRWEVTATAWVETDKNMPCLESLMNHIVYTKKYLQEHWEVDPASLKIDFSPDTFGHSAFLPELDVLGGIEYYYHCRGLDAPDKVLYRWQAPNGKELLMYKEPYWYNSGIVPQIGVGMPRMAALCGGLRTGMAVYGVGDHGGGPTRRDLNRALEMQEWPVFPALRFGRMSEYFAAAESVRKKLPVVQQELNCIFTGCYTTQSRIKQGNHRAENGLCTAEGLNAITARELGMPYSEKTFEEAWQKTLFTHFHDILTGSCVPESREYAMGLYQEALSVAQTRSAFALEQIAAAVDTSAYESGEDRLEFSEGAGVGYGLSRGNIPTHENGTGINRIYHIVNTAGVDRCENAEVTLWDWPGSYHLLEVKDANGNPLPFETEKPRHAYWCHDYMILHVTVSVPAHGYTTILVGEKNPAEVTDCFLYSKVWDRHHAPDADTVLENKYLAARFDAFSGELISLIDKTTGAQRIRAGESGGLRMIQTEMNHMSSWQIKRYISCEKVPAPVKITTHSGEVRAFVACESKVENSYVTTTVSLGKEDRFLKVELKIDWNEQSYHNDRIPVLAYTLPLADTTGRMLCDVPGGVQWREQQHLDVPCQRYGAAEFADGRVLALASDCKYGYRFSKGDLQVTLVNSGSSPDKYSDRGIQKVALFVLPAEADGASLARETDLCLKPLQYVTNTPHKGTLPTEHSFVKTVGETAVFTGIAQRGGSFALRMYEAAGKECPVTVTLCSPAKSARLCNLMGEALATPVAVEGRQVTFTLSPHMQAELRID